MLSLWRTGLSRRAGFAPPTGFRFSHFQGLFQKPGLLKDSPVMSRRSRKRRAKRAPQISVNDRLTIIKGFPDPVRTMKQFFTDVAVTRQNSAYIVIPEYENIGQLVQCTLKLNYPLKIEINSFGISKQNALNGCSLEVLRLLKDNGYISVDNFNLAFDSIKTTAKSDLVKSRKSALLDINQNVTVRRHFSTFSKLDIRGQVSEKPSHQRYEPKESKSIIHNYYSLISNYLDGDFKITSHYIQSANPSSQWTCLYTIKWPEEKTFAKSGCTKKESATKVCTEILNYLNSLKIIDSRGRPIFDEDKKVKKDTFKIISLKDTTVDKLSEINYVYKRNLLGDFIDSLDSASDTSIDQAEGLLSKQPNIKKYQSPDFYMAKEKTLLPISKFKDELIDTIENNQVVIVKGEPGCGKSTRVPQYILEGWAKSDTNNGKLCRIVVTQPRRIAAISLAEHVSNERDENVGQTVGYQVRLQNSFCPKTGRILYCTTGILLRKMQSDPNLYDCSHVILDEVHERDVNTDLLMNMLRHALNNNKNLKIVIMSATIDTGIFQEYFDGAPLFYVPGFTHQVKQHFIDQCSSMDFSKTLLMCEGKNPNVIHEDVVNTIKYIHTKKGDGAILCFLPGWEDIKTIANLLIKFADMQVLCLHSRLTMKEQKLIFSRPPYGMRKIILSTNIAETSVTIDDVVYVIDTGIQKWTKFDSSKGVTCLDNSWISQANIQQRKGRAGRCQPGESFHLYTKQKSKEFDEYPAPEILRTSLTKIVLDSKVYSNNMNAADFLSHLLTPPRDEAIQLAVRELIDLELLDADENLTPLGRTLSNFQLEPKLAKTMINAMIFKCVTPTVDIVTLFAEEKELFAGGFQNKEEIKRIKRDFSKISDHLALMKMFEKWLEYVETDENVYAKRFCSENSLVEPKLRTLQQLRDIHFGYLEKYMKNVLPISDDFSNNDELIKGVMLSGVGTLIEHSEKLKGKKKKHLLLTRNNHKAMITSESVNGKRTSYSSDYLIYINETVSNVRRTSVIRETSLVSLLTVLLFKSNKIVLEELSPEKYSADIDSTDQVLLTLEDTKYKYICDRHQAEVIKKCKEILQSMLHYYVFQLTCGGDYDPNINRGWDHILSILNRVLEEVQI